MLDMAPPLGRRGDENHRESGVLSEVRPAADTVHHPAAGDMTGVHISVDVDFNAGIQGKKSEAADKFGIIDDIPVSNHQMVLEIRRAGQDLLHPFAHSHAACGNGGHFAGNQELHHRLGDTTAEETQIPKVRTAECVGNGVGDAPEAHLNGGRDLPVS
jgi:hypothetical protein